MDDTEFKQYLLYLEGLSPAQKRKLSDALRVKDEGETVAEALEKRISVGGHCPHCDHDQLQRWGTAHGMQRHRCKSCLKTFNAVTGTPLARLRKKEKWLEYSRAMIDGLSVRKAARKCGIDTTTSFRWRHRFLHGLRDKKDSSLKGIVEADETFFLESFKGSRNLGRTARKRGGKAAKRGLSAEASSGSDREGPSRGDDGRSAQRPQRSLDHQSAQACRGAGRDPLHGREQSLSGICERRERHSCPADRFQEEQGH